MARPTKYKPEYCKDLIKFFNIEPIIHRDMTVTYKDGTTVDKTVAEAAPTPYFVDWQMKIGISHQTMLDWTKTYPEFLEAYTKAKHLQEKFIMECGLKSVHNAFMSVMTLKNVCGWRDRDIDLPQDGKELSIKQIFQTIHVNGKKNGEAKKEPELSKNERRSALDIIE